jgi:hypothetical protein
MRIKHPFPRLQIRWKYKMRKYKDLIKRINNELTDNC